MLTSIRNVKFIKMRLFTMFITAVWPKDKSLYDTVMSVCVFMSVKLKVICFDKQL